MSVLTVRGGVPRVFRLTIDGVGRPVSLPWWCNYLIVRNATATCRLYFHAEDFAADENYVLLPLPAATTPNGEWQGPVEAESLWLKSDGAASDVELVAFQRRG
jgi:hypothetical protein